MCDKDKIKWQFDENGVTHSLHHITSTVLCRTKLFNILYIVVAYGIVMMFVPTIDLSSFHWAQRSSFNTNSCIFPYHKINLVPKGLYNLSKQFCSMQNSTCDMMQWMGDPIFTKLPVCFVFTTSTSCNHTMLCILAELPSHAELIGV